MNKIFKILLVITIAISSGNALKKETLKETMSNNINTILLVLKDKNLDQDQKGEKIVEIIDSVFDYKTMSKIALGRDTWNSISKDKQEEFIKVFEKKLKVSYIGKLQLYNNQEVKIISLHDYKKSRLQLETQLLGADDTYAINYNFYKNKQKNEWFIYDVDLIGVSIIQTYRKQFSGLLKEKTFDEMINILKESNEKK